MTDMDIKTDVAGFGNLQGLEAISTLDIHFARLMTQLSGQDSPELFLAAALVSSQTREGHICLDLAELSNEEFQQEKLGENSAEMPIPSLEAMKSVLSSSVVVGKPGEFKPLILGENKLYLNRYWHYEDRLAKFIKNGVQATVPIGNLEELQSSLAKCFPMSGGEQTDWQRIAAATAVLKKFCVITGGPGTGKTYAIAKIIALMLEQSETSELRIILAAPTGKAAVRLQDSIRAAKTELNCPDEIKVLIPEEASTIHRLLGYIPNSPYFRHDADNPLDVDVMIVDEASMVDLALMAKLVQALPPDARLILLGDSNQLASVEAGAVLGDICDLGATHPYSKDFAERLVSVSGQKLEVDMAAESKSVIQDCIVRLIRSYRFESRKGIGEVSHAVNSGDGDLALAILKDEKFSDVEWHSLSSENIIAAIIQRFRDYDYEGNPRDLLERFERFRILCAVREGPLGVNATNVKIEKFVKRNLRIKQSEFWYPGQPVLITQNDYRLNLFNGDLGVILPDAQNDNELRAFFPGSEATLRKFLPFRLPEYETAYAMTVHKGQGSEFDEVLLLLPGKESPVLTRELIYTGITRAVKKVAIWGDEIIFRTAVSRKIRRASGLRDALWEAAE